MKNEKLPQQLADTWVKIFTGGALQHLKQGVYCMVYQNDTRLWECTPSFCLFRSYFIIVQKRFETEGSCELYVRRVFSFAVGHLWIKGI